MQPLLVLVLMSFSNFSESSTLWLTNLRLSLYITDGIFWMVAFPSSTANGSEVPKPGEWFSRAVVVLCTLPRLFRLIGWLVSWKPYVVSWVDCLIDCLLAQLLSSLPELIRYGSVRRNFQFPLLWSDGWTEKIHHKWSVIRGWLLSLEGRAPAASSLVSIFFLFPCVVDVLSFVWFSCCGQNRSR